MSSATEVALADHGKVSMGETVSDFLGQKCSDLPEAVAKITLVQLSLGSPVVPFFPIFGFWVPL